MRLSDFGVSACLLLVLSVYGLGYLLPGAARAVVTGHELVARSAHELTQLDLELAQVRSIVGSYRPLDQTDHGVLMSMKLP